MKMNTTMIEDRIDTLCREVKYMTDFLDTHRDDEHLRISFGFIFRCSSGPFHIDEYMLEDFNTNGEAILTPRNQTALLLDDPMVWFPTPEHGAEIVAALHFNFPSQLAHVFLRTPLAEINVRIKERQRQITALHQIIQPNRN